MKSVQRRSVLLIAMAMLVAGSIASAQPRGGQNIDRITNAINSCERRTNAFNGMLRRALNDSNVRYERKDDLLRDARVLEEAMDRTGESWNRDKDTQKTRVHVSEALNASRNINVTMRNRRLNGEAEREWVEVRRELNLMARAFGLQPVKW